MESSNLGLCACGKYLYPFIHPETKERIGITHTPEDEDHHLEFFASGNMIVLPVNNFMDS